MRKTAPLLLGLLAGLAFAAPALGGEHEVRMLNKSANGPMAFEPSLVRIAPSDTVRFVPTDKGHNAESIQVMTPEGGTMFKGKMKQEIAVTFDKAGVYGYQCKPHYGLGMVGIVVGGDPANLGQAAEAKHPARAKQRFEQLFQAINRN